ncbi:MAG TPA: UbiA family prenyltransferase [Chthoniobacteraceae bacterium]|jgi:4-hydroxybenzoate polyprenyltransferase|nr:UbiA family prenyltransferase [Chthoniobacteraceae bacterium]
MPSRFPSIRAWLQLFRAPNLLTVPGDPLAGYFLASFGAIESGVWLAMAASLCFYAGGLLLNDLADLREDHAERPHRPLPSGAASREAVIVVFVALCALGLWICSEIDRVTLLTGVALLAAIGSYNLFTKRIPVVGALNMGACRSLSMLLGATAVSHGNLTYRLIGAGRLDHVLIAVVLVGLYIAAVTNLARFETRVHVPAVAKWLPVLPLVIGGILFLAQLTPAYAFGAGALLTLASIFAVQIASELTRQPALPVPPQIGKLIRLILLVQAAFCAVIGVEGALAASLLMLLWPLARILGRWFYAS